MHRPLRGRLRRVGIGAWLLLILLLHGSAHVRAQASYTYRAPLLRMDPHARTAALGGAFTAMAADYNLLRYNPAGLSVLGQPLLSASYHSWIAGTSQNHYELAFPIRRGGLGMSISYLDAGSIEEIDADFQKTGLNLHSNDLLFLTGGAQRLRLGGGTLAVGLGLRYLYQNLAGFSGTSFGLDVGSLYAYGPLTAGLTVQNLALHPARFHRALEPLPRTLRAGLTYHVNRHSPVSWLMAMDLVQPHPEAPVTWHVGTEMHLAGLTMRSGYQPRGRAGRWLAGLGLAIPLPMFTNDARVTFDYAYALPTDGWGSTHYLSIALHPGHQRSTAFNDEPRYLTIPLASETHRSILPDTLATDAAAPLPPRPRALASPMRLPPAPPADDPAARALAWPPARAVPLPLPADVLALRPPRAADLHRLPPRPIDEQPDLIRAYIHFEYGRATIPPSEHEKLDRLAAQLAAAPERHIWVSGHTDNRGTLGWNLDLSERRVESVLAYLEAQHGLPRERFVKPTAYGETRPIADNSTATGRALNRRVEFMRLPPSADPDTFVPEASVVEGVHALSEQTVAIFRNGQSAYDVTTQDNGRRLVLDFPGLFRVDGTQPVPPVRRRLIRRLRTEETESPQRTRVIIDLVRPVSHRIDDQGRVLMLHLDASNGSAQ